MLIHIISNDSMRYGITKVRIWAMAEVNLPKYQNGSNTACAFEDIS